jgi:hypothetical protein
VSYDECKIDSNFRKHIRTTFPGACSLEYQQVIKIFINCMLNWDPKKQHTRGKGIFGTMLAFAPAHEEQGRRTLHSHWQIRTEDLSPQVHKDLLNSDRNIRNKSREAFY